MPRGHVTGLLHYFLCCCVTLAFCFSNRVVSVEECGGHGVEGAVCHCGEARTVQPSVDEHSRHELCVCVLMDFPTTVLQKLHLISLKLCLNIAPIF